MLKAHNVGATNPPSPTESNATPTKGSAGKKRGAGAATSDETPVKRRARGPAKSKAVKKESDDDEEDTKPPQSSKSSKCSKKKTAQKVKNEDEGDESALSGMCLVGLPCTSGLMLIIDILPDVPSDLDQPQDEI